MFVKNLLVSALLLGCSFSGASSADLGGGDGDDLKGSQRGHLVRPPSPTLEERQKELEKEKVKAEIAELKRKAAESDAATAKARADEAKADGEIADERARIQMADERARQRADDGKRESDRAHNAGRLRLLEEKQRILQDGSSGLLDLAGRIKTHAADIALQRKEILDSREAVIAQAQRCEASWCRRMVSFISKVDPGSGAAEVTRVVEEIRQTAEAAMKEIKDVEKQIGDINLQMSRDIGQSPV